MNNVILTGRIANMMETNEFKIKGSKEKGCSKRIVLAVNDGRKDEDGNYIAEFIDCVLWNHNAKFVDEYCDIGDLISISGTLRKNIFEKDDVTYYNTDVHVSQLQLLVHSKSDNSDDADDKYESKKKNKKYTRHSK